MTVIRQLFEVAAALVFLEVLLPGEAGAGAAVAVFKGAEQRHLGRQVHLVHFALVSQQTPRVREARVELAPGLAALIGPLVAVHVLVPLADPLERLVLAAAVDVVAVHLVVFVARRCPRPPHGALHSVELGVDQWWHRVLVVGHVVDP